MQEKVKYFAKMWQYIIIHVGKVISLFWEILTFWIKTINNFSLSTQPQRIKHLEISQCRLDLLTNINNYVPRNFFLHTLKNNFKMIS